MLVDPPALRAGLPLPAGYGALIQLEGGHDSLHRAAVGQQRHHREHQPPRLVRPIEGGAFRLGEGLPAAFAPVATLLLAVDDDVPLANATVGAAVSVVAPCSSRVHAATPLVWRSETKQG